MLSLSVKVNLGWNSRVLSIAPERWSNQHGWGLILSVRMLLFFGLKVQVTRAYGV